MNDKVGAELFNYFDRFAQKNKALVTQFMGDFPIIRATIKNMSLTLGQVQAVCVFN